MLLVLLHFIEEVGSPHLPSPTSVCSVFLYTGARGGGGGGVGGDLAWVGVGWMFSGTVTTLLRFLIALGAVT